MKNTRQGFLGGFLVLVATSGAFAQGAMRMWTDAQGRKVQAEFGGVEGGKVLLRMPGGKMLPFEIGKLSAADQDFVKAQSAPGAQPAAAGAGKPGDGSPFAALDAMRLPAAKRIPPVKVDVPPRSVEIEITKESADERQFIYRSEAFEFSSQAKLAGSVMKKVAIAFEATRELLRQLPWGLVCVPPEGFERYQAKLFETRQDYLAAGAPELSGGVYNSGTKVFMVPFQSIGLEKRGQTYFRNDSFRNDTLVHEITHQLMDSYLPFLPKWVIEGTAEYTEMLPDLGADNGFLASKHEKGVKDYIQGMTRRAGQPGIPSLEEHMTMKRETWDANAVTGSAMATLYYRSALLVYYFNHLEGDGKGGRFMQFMDAVHEEVRKAHEFFANPAVKRSPDGSFSYPRSLEAPDFRNGALKHVNLLLGEKTFAAVAADIVAKYKAIGVKITVN